MIICKHLLLIYVETAHTKVPNIALTKEQNLPANNQNAISTTIGRYKG